MKKIIYLFIFVALFFYFSVSSSLASSENFLTDYDLSYTVNENTSTHVNIDVTLTNKTAQYYASSYDIQLAFKNVSNLQAHDPDGSITPNLSKNSNGENIQLTFNKKVVGIGNKLNFTLSFDTNDVAQKIGKIWEINIPGLSNQNDFQTFNVRVRVPPFLGNPTYIKPETAQAFASNLIFTKDKLGKSGISMAFGDEQIYKFNLTYHLNNSNLFPIKTEIALPPSTNYQDVQIDSISPKPLNVKEDKDGNWLAQYTIAPSKKLDVVAIGRAKIYLNPKKEILTKDKLKDYLKEQPYWQISNPDIKKLADSLKTPYAIYEYVVKNLKYDFSRVTENQPREGAQGVLKNPSSAVCLEFTDLFIALSRAAGIPARQIYGFAHTQNEKERPLSLVKDILHAWPEYYDADLQTWIVVDPTWGNTTGGVDYFHTLDLDHFAFVVKGEDSNYPIPAGGYKLKENVSSKDVDVNFDENFVETSQELTINEDFSKSYLSNFPINANITITNKGRIAIEPQEILVTSKYLLPLTQKILSGRVPPYGFIIIPINFARTPLLTNRSDVVTISINNQSVSKVIKISPFFLFYKNILGGIIIVITIIVLSFITIKTGHIPFLRRKE